VVVAAAAAARALCFRKSRRSIGDLVEEMKTETSLLQAFSQNYGVFATCDKFNVNNWKRASTVGELYRLTE